jgi:outer membrane protein OmpA-like peptidoglycan-associated protein
MRCFEKARLLAILSAFALLAACVTDPYTGERKLSKTVIGAGIGAATGAAIGAATGGNRGKRAAIGAGVGVLAGGAVGGYMDYQEAKLRERLAGTGVGVTRVGDEIVLRMPGNVTFETDRADIRPTFYDVLGSVALVIQEYDKTVIEITGYTDSTGTASYNQELSTRRAANVGAYLQSQGVIPQRVLTQGFGEEYPVADNATAAGRQANRRVELRLVPITG